MRTVSDLMDLGGRRAAVTGGAGHIGRAIAEALVELGATVSILDLDENDCRRESDRLNGLRAGSAHPFSCDLRDEASTRQTIRAAIDRMGGLEILIHAAAYVGTTDVPGWAVPFEEQIPGVWEDALRVNLTAAFVLVQEAAPALRQGSHGSVIFFGSIYGMVGPDNRMYEGTSIAQPAGYAASKGGLILLTRYLATTLAPKIRVNTITPGGVWRGQDEKFHARYRDRTPLDRMATENDMVGAIAYLASDMSSYVTGQNLVVDGGWTAW